MGFQEYFECTAMTKYGSFEKKITFEANKKKKWNLFQEKSESKQQTV